MSTDGMNAQANAELSGFRRLGQLLSLQGKTEFPDILERHIEERRQLENVNALTIELHPVVHIVLCTGGPHCEVLIDRNDNASIVCYDWFGADRIERELTPIELAGVTNTFGTFDDLVDILG